MGQCSGNTTLSFLGIGFQVLTNSNPDTNWTRAMSGTLFKNSAHCQHHIFILLLPQTDTPDWNSRHTHWKSLQTFNVMAPRLSWLPKGGFPVLSNNCSLIKSWNSLTQHGDLRFARCVKVQLEHEPQPEDKEQLKKDKQHNNAPAKKEHEQFIECSEFRTGSNPDGTGKARRGSGHPLCVGQ